MLEYNDVMTRLEEMRSRYKDGFSSSDRILLESLNQMLFSKTITKTGCSDCYRDAYIIIYNRLKALGKMPQLSNYKLKAGILIHTFGSQNFYSLSVPDEVAEDYLRANPENIREFQRYPEDWAERIKNTSTEASAENDETSTEDSAEDDETPSEDETKAEENTESEAAKEPDLFNNAEADTEAETEAPATAVATAKKQRKSRNK